MSERGPIFVGGTGRSGTTIVARLLGSHPSYYMIPIEVRFIASPGGLGDLISGACDFEKFAKLITNPWWYRTTPNGQTRGLHKIVPRDRLEVALARFRDAMAEIPVDVAARNFVSDLLDPLAAEASAQSWIEMTPPNVLVGAQLRAMMPDLRLVHSIRDGREVAASVTRMHWGPDDPFEALDWWCERMLQASLACTGLDDQLLTVQLEDLVIRSRDETLQRLFDFADLDMTPEVEKFVSENLREDRARPGRWRDMIPSSLQESYDVRYRACLDKLRDAGAPVPS